MNVRMMWATALRVLRQLRADPRSMALIVAVPALLVAVIYWLFQNEKQPPGVPRTFDSVGLMMLGIFPFVIMFLITSITMLRERTSGTLERLLTTPIHKADLLFGYALAFSIMAVIQSLVATAVTYWIFGLDIRGNPAWTVLIAVMTSVLGVTLGLLCSAFATTEFQAVQFMPVVVIPQILLCGLFVARGDMNGVLEAVSNVLPLTFAVDGLQQLAANTNATAAMFGDVLVIAGFAVAGLILAALTLRRRSS